MTGRRESGAAGYFGRQVRRERTAARWTIQELAQRAGIDAAHLGRVEAGKRPPTERIAIALDTTFPGRRGWFRELYDESQTWSEIPAGFRSWGEHEDRATSLRAWQPGIVDGLCQTEGYARALIAVEPAIDDVTRDNRLHARTARQAHFWGRERPVVILVDELALYRLIASAEVMAEQLRRLCDVAAMPKVTLQVVPAVAHAGLASGFMITDEAAWCEHVSGGFVYSDPEALSALALRFDSLRGECYRVSESLRIIERLAELWIGGQAPTAQVPAANA